MAKILRKSLSKQAIRSSRLNDFKFTLGLLLPLFMIICLVYPISAQFETVKIYDSTIKTETNDYLKDSFNSKYGIIRLSKSFLWIPTDKIAEYSLIENTERCLINCEAQGKVVLYEDRILFDDVKFETLSGQITSIRNSDYYLLDGYLDNYVDVPDIYKEICLINNKTLLEECHQEIETYKKENQPKENWIKYNGEILKAGSYRWKIKGIKDPSQSVDFIPIINNQEFNEWAVWNSSFESELMGYWKFDDSILNNTLVNDSTARDHNGYLEGTAGLIADGKIGGALELYGDTSDVKVNTSLTDFNFYKNFSVSFWIKLKDLSANKGILHKGNIASTQGAVSILYNNPTEIQGYINSAAEGGGTGTFTDTTNWNMITMTKSGDNIKMYVNGTLKGTYASTSAVTNNAYPLYFGVYYGTGFRVNAFLDEMGIWNRTLSPNEVTDLYNGGTGLFYGSSDAPIDNPPTITILSNNWVNQSFSGRSNCYKAIDDYGILNLTFYYNGQINETYFNTTANQTFNQCDWIEDNEGIHSWFVSVNDGTNIVNSSVQYFSFDFTAPNMTLNSITQDITNILPYNYSLNFTRQDLTSGFCWYSTSDNSTNQTFTCNTLVNITFSNYITKTYSNATDKFVNTYVTGTGYINFTRTNNLTTNVKTEINYAHAPDIATGYISCLNRTSNSFSNFISLDESVNNSYQMPLECLKNTTIELRYILDSFGGYKGKLYNLDLSLKPNKTIYYATNDSSGRKSQNFTSFFLNYITSTIGYNLTVLEGETTPIQLYVTTNNLVNASATLKYINQSYNMSYSISEDNILFYYNLPIPAVSQNTNNSFNITYSINGYNFTTINYYQLVYNFTDLIVSTSPCSPATYKFSLYAETNRTKLEGATIDYNFKYGLSNNTMKEIYGTLTNVTDFYLCINDTINPYWNMGYGEIEYVVEGFTTRRYYIFTGTRLTNTTITIPLYDLATPLTTEFLITTQSTNLIPFVNHYVSLLRWYPENNSYAVVDVGKTDDKGQTILKVETVDVDYRIGIYKTDGTLVELISPIRMICQTDPCVYSIYIDAFDLDLTLINNIQQNLSFDSTIKVFTFIWNDISQQSQTMNLSVYKVGALSSTLLCSSSSTSYTGVLSCDVSAYTGQLKAVVVRTASPPINIASLIVNIRSTIIDAGAGVFGLFIGAILLIFFALIGTFNPIIAVILAIISLLPLYLLGSITWEIFMAIGVLGGVVIHFLRRTTL